VSKLGDHTQGVFRLSRAGFLYALAACALFGPLGGCYAGTYPGTYYESRPYYYARPYYGRSYTGYGYYRHERGGGNYYRAPERHDYGHYRERFEPRMRSEGRHYEGGRQHGGSFHDAPRHERHQSHRW
jgi:hypothetical protein